MIGTLISFLVIALCAVGMVGMVQAEPSQVTSRPLNWFRSRKQPRKAFSKAELESLGQSLKERQLQPLVCLNDGTIICGERRFRAAQIAGLTHLEVKIIDENLTETQIRILQLVENMQRQDLTPQEQVHGAIELMALNLEWRRKDCAAHLKLDPSMITKLLSYLDAVTSVQDAFNEGLIGIRDMAAIAALPGDQQQGLLNLKLSSGVAATEIEAQSRKARNGKPSDSQQRVSRIKCIVPGKSATVQITGQSSLSLEQMIEVALEWTRRARRASEQGWDCKTLERACKDESKKGKC